jgi:hypothetical protein
MARLRSPLRNPSVTLAVVARVARSQWGHRVCQSHSWSAYPAHRGHALTTPAFRFGRRPSTPVARHAFS